MLLGGEARVRNNGAGGSVLRSTDVRRSWRCARRMERADEAERRGVGGRGGRGAERRRWLEESR